MDGFFSLFGKSMKELGKSPILLLAGLILGALSLPLLAGYIGVQQMIRSALVDFSQLVVPLLITPFITGGALGYALEVREKGSSSLSTFFASAKKSYPKLLICGIIAFIVYYFLLTAIMVFVLAGTVDPFIGSMLGFLMLGLTFFVLMSIEFYDIDVVSKGSGIMAAFRNSMDFARKNLLTAAGFFIMAVVLKSLVQLPLSFGMAGAMISNETYYNALMAMSNASANATNATAANASVNMTTLLSMGNITLSPEALVVVGIFQMLIQGFVFALLALFKANLYMVVRNRKKITDFDYDFSDEESP
ncbi:conserved hypothetical protein [Methanocella paludicola SANAE]|uniref:DUF7847 domain-containing protein n=1 Tax=Methanocella paludicola (strain DSM 17711 / JCM 13418 / NBRC 101707 / SANAE) TaxID=304371 RepID=D1YVD2_METPS|nr:hypothetical protein [Methanocella paludicola]BAI60404.1 conserved hypothetical protein [Methanocella paludicola SANAE]